MPVIILQLIFSSHTYYASSKVAHKRKPPVRSRVEATPQPKLGASFTKNAFPGILALADDVDEWEHMTRSALAAVPKPCPIVLPARPRKSPGAEKHQDKRRQGKTPKRYPKLLSMAGVARRLSSPQNQGVRRVRFSILGEESASELGDDAEPETYSRVPFPRAAMDQARDLHILPESP